MLEVVVVDMNNNRVGSVALDEKIFGRPVNTGLLHEAVIMQLNNQRQGTHCTKTKGLVSGGGKKPWKQKGTGRARVGSMRSPVWVGGGTIFGPLPRDYSYQLPRKKSRVALHTALSSKLADSALVIVDLLDGKSGKTREAASVLKALNVNGSALIVCDNKDNTLYRGVKNMSNVAIVEVRQINVYDLLKYKHLVISKGDVEKLMEVWS